MRSTAFPRLLLAATIIFAAVPAFGQETLLASLGGAAVGADDGGAIVEIDQTTGAATVLGTPLPGVGLTGLAASSTGRVFAVTDNASANARLIEIDPQTGGLIGTIGDLMFSGSPVTMHDIAFQPGSDVLFGSAIPGNGLLLNDLVTIDTSNAQVAYVGTPNFGTADGVVAIGFSTDGTLWAKEANDGEFWTLDPTDGSVLTTSVTNPSIGSIGLAARPSDGTLVLSECCNITLANDIYLLDPASGDATLLGPAGGDRRVHDFTFVGGQPPIVEIPTLGSFGFALLALLLGAAGVAGLRRRR